jgi:FkbM family methyltransferase
MPREEQHVVDALVSLCREIGPECLIQIGAEDGYEAMRIREATGCRVIAIDGDMRSRPASPYFEFHHLVIGKTDCFASFYVHATSGLSSTLARGDSNETRIQREEWRLDTFCEMHGGIRPDALIIDTEGTTMEVLEGCGALIDGVKLVYAECQNEMIRPGVSLFADVDRFLVEHGMTLREGLPSYDAGCQSNYTWVRP